MMAKNVTLVEINVYEKMVPLVSGYLQAYACTDADLRRSYRFNKYTTSRSTPFVDILQELTREKADLYAFSCYLWNIGLVKSLLPALLKLSPEAQFLLGGPQVMFHAEEFLSPDNENVLVCNGEGEHTFANLLRELSEERPSFSKVQGLSFYRDRSLVTTEHQERARDLDAIPSPYLNGLFDREYEIGVIETNRGCPFHCGFCFWGAATNDKVVKFSEDRIREDISWISRNNIPFLCLADANWGMLKRDIGISEHIAKSKRDNGLPIFVYFSAAKNSPDRVTEITEIFTREQLLNAQPISMQSLSDTSLDYVDRKNIKLSAYEHLQANLNEKQMSSFIELIWPLPGETLTSFKQGIQKLCESNASHIITYPHLLLHNTPLYEEREKFELVTQPVEDGVAEAQIVVQTAEVSLDEFQEGMWFLYAVLALYNTRSIPELSDYLHKSGSMSYSELYTSFIGFCRKDERNVFVEFCEKSIANADYYDIFNYAMVYHIVGHEDRVGFDSLLYRFACSQKWWSDERARVLFELDMLSKPFIYSNTEITKPEFPLQSVNVLDVSDRSYIVDVPLRHRLVLERLIGQSEFDDNDDSQAVFRIDHKRAQYPFRPAQSRQENANYCNGVTMRVETIRPTWSRIQVP